MRQTRNLLYPLGYRGFESLPLRQFMTATALRTLIGVFIGVAFACATAFAQATDPPAKSRDELLLVYWSARDCGWCSYWESSWSGMEKSLREAPAFTKMTYRVVKSHSLRFPYAESDFPDDLKWLHARGDRHPGRPGWTLYVNRELVATFYGTNKWFSDHLPKINELAIKYSGAR